MVTALEAVLLADGTCRDQPDVNVYLFLLKDIILAHNIYVQPDTASSGTGSPGSVRTYQVRRRNSFPVAHTVSLTVFCLMGIFRRLQVA